MQNANSCTHLSFGAWEMIFIVSVVQLVPTSVYLWVVSISSTDLTEL